MYSALVILGLVVKDNSALYIPPDFSEFTHAINFPWLKGTGGDSGKPLEPIVGYGPNIKLYFPNLKGLHAVKYPGGVHHGSRITGGIPIPKSVLRHALDHQRKHKVPHQKMNAAANKIRFNNNTYI